MTTNNYDWMDEKPTETAGLVVQNLEPGEEEAGPDLSEHCVELDKWGIRRGVDLHQSGEFFDLGLGAPAVADFYGMAFEREPKLLEHCADQTRAQFVNALNDNPDYRALHTKTALDVTASEMAALQFCREYGSFKQKRENKQQQQRQRMGKQAPNSPQEGQTQGQAGQPSPQERLRQEMEAMAAANRATERASKDVQELEDMRQSMGIGSEDGGGASINPAAMKQTFQRVKGNRQLQDIIERAGRYRMLARSKQREKVIHGYDDMIGVTLGNDLPKLLPHELAAVVHPLLKLDALRRFTERQMMQREYRGIERVAKGPIMVLIDESSSMNGHKIVNAKALALAMAWIAKHQKRWCGLVGWSSHNQQRWLALPPNRWPAPTVFLDWMSHMFGGGTDLPLHKIPEIYQSLGAVKGRTDLIIITDGETSQVGKQVLDRFRVWQKESKARIIGISIEAHARGLREISDEFFHIPSLNINSEAVERVVSL